MADLREAFPVLQNPATTEGEVLDRVQQGQAVAAKNGLMGWSFKDQAGNAIAPTLTAEGKIPVDFQGAGSTLRAAGELAAGSAALADVTGAVLTLTASKTYRRLHMTVSCRRDALFQLVQVDDVTETVLAEVVVGPGQYTFTYSNDDDEIVSGAAGDQELKVVAKNFEAQSSLRATLSAVEQVAGA